MFPLPLWGGRDGWAETFFTSVDTISLDLKADREARHKSAETAVAGNRSHGLSSNQNRNLDSEEGT